MDELPGRPGAVRRPLSAAGKGTSELRRQNLSRVLRSVYAAGALTRVGIARDTGLTKTAAGDLAAQLLAYGLLTEDEAVAEGVGRPGAPLRFTGRGFAAACIEVRASSVETLVADLDGRTVARRSEPTQVFDEAAILERVTAVAAAAAGSARERGARLLDVVVAVHGVVDPRTSRLLYVPRFDWRGVDLRAAVASALPPSVDVLVENDANLGALAEFERVASRGVTHLVSINTDLGVGAGAVLDGSLYRGSGGFAGELGHVVLDPDGPSCVCGRHGCTSALVGLRRVMREALPEAATAMEWVPGYEAAARLALRAAAEEEDETALAALARAGGWLGRAAAALANVLDPEVVVVGGYLADLAEWVMPEVRASYGRMSLRDADPGSVVCTSVLGDLRALTGGIHLSRTRLLDDPMGVLHDA